MAGKIQVGSVGGLRKVIRPGGDTTVGTTIAEIGAQTVTLAQLAVLLGITSGSAANPGTPAASIAVGPGLTGGGTVVGVVQIGLQTIPSVISIDSGGGGDSGYGDGSFMMPPGQQGPQGKQGATIYLPAEDGEDAPWIPGQPGQPGVPGIQGPPGFADDPDDPMLIPGPQGIQGIQGPIGPSGGGSGGAPVIWFPDDPDDPQMIPGNPGPQGATGATGAPAAVSIHWPDDGEDAPWIPGQQGIQGITGYGIQGVPGATGDDGEDGLWIPGQQGQQGLMGLQGPPGFEGDAGEDALFMPGPAGAAGSGSGGTPAAPANSIQFNNAGAFGGSANLIWNGTSLIVTGTTGSTAANIAPAAGTIGLAVTADDAVFAIRNAALTSVVNLATVKGWLGSGTNTTDAAIGAGGALNIYTSASSVARLAISAAGQSVFGNSAINANAYVARFLASSTTGQSFGVQICAGTNSSDAALAITNQAQTLTFFQITGTGGAIFSPTTATNAISATGVANAYTAVLNASSSSGLSFGLRLQAGTTSADSAVSITNQANTASFMLIKGDGSGFLGPTSTTGISWDTAGETIITQGTASTNIVLQLKPSGSNVVGLSILDPGVNATQLRLNVSNTSITVQSAGGSAPINFLVGSAGTITNMSLTTAGGIQGHGPVNTGLVDMTPDASTFTITYTGMAAGVTGTAVWTRVGNLVILFFPAATGTSNLGSFTATGLPSAIHPARAQHIAAPSEAFENNTVTVSTPVGCAISGGTVTFWLGGTTSWTASGTKGVINGGFSIAYLLN